VTIQAKVAAVYAYTLAPRDPVPLVRGWNRLEGRPRSADFDRSLRAEVRDPLWFLTRQWQYGEFEGDDAGSPIDARVGYASWAVDGYAAGDGAAGHVALDLETPLEASVEGEAPPFDLMLHMQAARVFERLLVDRGRGMRMNDHVAAYPLDYANAVAGADTVAARSLHRLGRARLFDAAKLLAAVADGTHATSVDGFPGMTPAEASDLKEAGLALADWYDRTYGAPVDGASAWRGERLAYRFECNASSARVRFVAEHYDGGHLDWTAFDVVRDAPAPPAAMAQALSFLPAAIQFAGMPSPRYWEMEDARTEFGHLDVNTNDLAKLLLAEFMLICSNDWCLLPLELDVGTYTRIEGLLVTDVFGDRTLVRAADRGADSEWQRWSMFRLNGDDASSPGLLLVPALTSTVVAPSVERVCFLRDEMANLVWAVEHRVMDRMGDAFDPATLIESPAPPPATNAPARYVLGGYVPLNWRPFMPVHVPGSMRSIRLQRARLPDQPLTPVGRILHADSPYIAEEEVPRAGRSVDLYYKRARGVGGTSLLWLARRSTVGRGEGSSGLAFDQVEEAPKKGA
jgi:hypothetical protein